MTSFMNGPKGKKLGYYLKNLDRLSENLVRFNGFPDVLTVIYTTTAPVMAYE